MDAMRRKETGSLGEKLARCFLEQKGYTILETNFRSSYGEIDIVARNGDYLVFVEVRTKRSLSFGTPEESVTPLKREHLIATAQDYYQRHENLPELWRIDLVAVQFIGKTPQFELIENAVSEL
ncbi:MAG: YraN family protein [Chloroflexota bacterium]